MADQKPFDETIFPAANLNWDVTTLNFLLTLIRKTVIQKNHEIIIDTLKQMLTRLTDQERWEGDFEKTILSVLAQKEAAEKVVKYEGLLGFDELEEFKEYSFYNFLYPGNPVRLSINSPEKNSTLCRVTISSDSHEYLPIGLFEKFKNGWFKKFHQISGPPLPQARAEKTNILALPNNCILSFEKDRWWHRIKGVQGSKHECYRHEALEMVTINNMKAFLTEEAWADIIKSDQPILED